MSTDQMRKTATRDILKLLGFEEDWKAMADEQPGYLANLGNITLKANQVTGFSFRSVFLFTGTASNGRSMKMIQFELPLHVESFEQGVALIVRGIGPEFEPSKPSPWFALGREWEDRLPAFVK